MKLSYLWLLPAVVLLSSCAAVSSDQPVTVGSGPVQVDIPASIRLVSVDGAAISSPNLYMGHYRLQLEPGEHQLVVQYEANWNTSDDSGHIIQWPRQQFSASFRPGEEYQFRHAAIDSREQAEHLADSHPLWLNAAGQTLAGDEVRDVQRLTFLPANSDDALQLLKQQWQSLTEAEKQQFRQWLQNRTD